VTFQFAYDEDVVKIAYDHLTKAFGRVWMQGYSLCGVESEE
jgi:hypothetical protein